MTFSHPGWLWLLVLAVPIVAFHLRMRRKQRVVVPSLLAYDPQALGEASPRAAGLRPRDLVGLLLELAALGALALAAAGPVEGAASVEPKPLAIVLDGSCSTKAVGRFEEMRGIARRALESVGPDTPVSLLLAAGEVRVLADAAAPRAAVEKALAEAKPRVIGAGALGPAAEMAASSDAEVLVLTDGCDRDAAALAAREDLRIVSVGKPERNRAVVGYSVELRRPREGSLILRVRDEDGTLREEDVSREFTAALKLSPLDAGDFGVRRSTDPPVDALPVDDFVVVPTFPLRPLAVAVVTGSGRMDPYLAAALESCLDVLDGSRTVAAGPEGYSRIGFRPDVVVSGADLPDAGRPSLVLGGGEGEVLRAPVVQPGDSLHPVMRGVDPSEWIVTRGRVLVAQAGDAVLLGCPSGPLALAGRRAGVRCVLLGFDPAESTMPLSGAWPVFLRNALLWLAEEPGPEVPPDPESVRLFSSSRGAPMRSPFLLDAEESDLIPRVPRNAGGFVPPTRPPRGTGPRSLAADFAAAGAGLLLLEWALFLLAAAPSRGRSSIALRAP